MSEELQTELLGAVVQINPSSGIGCKWGPQFVVVTEVKAWGVQGYFTQVTGVGKFHPAYIRLNNGEFAIIGRAEWVSKGRR